MKCRGSASLGLLILSAELGAILAMSEWLFRRRAETERGTGRGR